MENPQASTKDNNSTKGTNVQVAVRCRPTNEEERKAGQPSVITCDPESKSVKVSYGPAGKKVMKSFNFDKVFGMYSTQEQVFEQVVRPIVDEVLAGFNCTIFAYGQTGTGKTHTMEGDINSDDNAGIVPRSVKSILEQLETSGTEFTIRVSFLELYNEELRDLLNPAGDKQLKLCEDIKKGVVCQNLEEITVLNAKDIFEILHRGIEQRKTAETMMNKNSSRSHSIFTMKIMIKEYQVDGEEVVRHGQLNLVDLAGSECIGRSGAKNDRAREAGSINQSLLTLGRVITALVDHHGHIPYRDSKLTRLLQESLGGKAKTCIIATLSPSQLAMEESLSTLDYAYRAKNIKNQPTVNQKMTKKVVLKEYCAEIEHLKAQLQITREKNGVYVEPNEFYAMEARIASQENQLTECESALRSKTDEVKLLKSENIELSSNIDTIKIELNEVKDDIVKITEKYEETKDTLEFTKVELKASDAVVGEQSVTESALHEQGSNLKSELQTRREDVHQLLAKIDRFLDMESQRAKSTDEMTKNMQGLKSSFYETTQSFKSTTDSQSIKLVDGITDMLSRSRTTCECLRTSINSALTILIDDSKAAKDAMASSCDGLNKHLVETNKHVAKTLNEVQKNLSKWLDDVDSSMKTTQQQLNEQNKKIHELQECVANYATSFNNQNTSLINLQKSNSQEMSIAVESIKKELLIQLEKFQTAQATHTTKSKEFIEQQAQEMEQTICSMLRTLVQKSVTSLQESADSAKEFCRDVHVGQSAGLEKMSSMITSQSGQVNNMATQMLSSLNESHNQQVQFLNQIEQSRVSADNSLNNVSGSVESQKQAVNKTVTDMVTHVHTAVNKACDSVSNTSEAANKILHDVTSATVNMNNSASDSMNKFTEFLDSKGDHMKTDISSHFTGVTSYLNTQKENIQKIDEAIDTYTSSVEASKVQVTGKTPMKTVYKHLPTLPVTREHNIIKNEVRANPDAVIIPTLNNSESMMSATALDVNCEIECDDYASTTETESNRGSKSSTKRNKDSLESSTHSEDVSSAKHRKSDDSLDNTNLENIRPEVLNEMAPPAVISSGKSLTLSNSLHKTKTNTTTNTLVKENSSIPSAKRTRKTANA